MCINVRAMDIEEYRIFFFSSLFSTLLFSPPPPPRVRLFLKNSPPNCMLRVTRRTKRERERMLRISVRVPRLEKRIIKCKAKLYETSELLSKRILHKLYIHTYDIVHTHSGDERSKFKKRLQCYQNLLSYCERKRRLITF